MGAIIEVKPETAAKLLTLAEARGVSVDELLAAYVPGLGTNGSSEAARSQEEKVNAFIRWAKSHPTDKPLLSDEAISRKSIYES